MEVDIAIIGGGVAGCIAAIALAKFYNVVLVDKLEQPQERIGECLAPASRRILAQLDLLDGLEKASSDGQSRHLKNMGTISYWGSEKAHIADPLRNPDGFGWHLDRKAFEMYLREAALQRDVHCFWPAALQDVHYENFRWHLNAKTIVDGGKLQTHCFEAKFVIDASGRQSHFARKSGVQRQHFDKLIACWATMTNYEIHQMSTISSDEFGWWYSAPLPGNKRVMALQTDSDLIRHGIIKSSIQFMELAQSNREMAKIIEKNQGEIKFHKTVAANSTRLMQVAGRQWAALGDAAISFDPLSSQGMFNAMASSMQLAELIQELDFIKNPDLFKIKQFETIYTDQTDEIWKHYTRHKQIFYRQEMRWKEALFWQRRH